MYGLKVIAFLSNIFFQIVPLQWLPPLKKAVGTPPGQPTIHVELSPQELRERHAESFSNRLKFHIQRANIIGNYIARRREEVTRKKHYLLIGELCVKFSNLEQEIKKHLRRFDDDEKHDTKSGKPLVEAFNRALSKSSIEQETKEKIEAFLADYLIVARERNQALKATYLYGINDSQMKKENHRAFGSFHGVNWEQNIENWIQPFDQEEHRLLIEKVEALFQELLKINYDYFHHLPPRF